MDYPNIEVVNLDDGRGPLFVINRYAGGGTQTLTRQEAEELLCDMILKEDEESREMTCSPTTPCFFCQLHDAVVDSGV